jgi:hypothetical protein
MKIFVGYDPVQDQDFKVCEYSIKKHEPNAEVIPLKLAELDFFKREPDSISTTEFTFTRFLVPYLMNYTGVALYVDCDFVFTDSVAPLFELTQPVYVVKHNYKSKTIFKMDGKLQSIYERKNWSSLIVFNCGHPSNRILTPDVISTAAGLYLHQFRWLRTSEIGELDPTWNHLVGWSNNTSPKGIHYTEGSPRLDAYKNTEYANLWLTYNDELKSQS